MKSFGETIDSIVDRYNSVVEAINAPGDYKFLDGTCAPKTRLHLIFRSVIIVSVCRPAELKTDAAPVDLKRNMAKKKKDTKVR